MDAVTGFAIGLVVGIIINIITTFISLKRQDELMEAIEWLLENPNTVTKRYAKELLCGRKR